MTAPASTIESKSKSRRALLAGALGGLGAWAASAVGRASPVRAEGEVIHVGDEFTTATSRTRIRNETNGATVFAANSGSSGTALDGSSSTGVGVRGSSNSHIGVSGDSSSSYGVSGYSYSQQGVYGSSTFGLGVGGFSTAADQPAIGGHSFGNSTGLLGYSSESGALPPAKPKTGVYGYANQDTASRGVWGFSGRGAGLYGQANKNGFAVRANGRIKADKVSGVATIPAGATGVTISPGVNVIGSSFVLLTPRANIGSRGLWYVPNATADTFRIRMSSSRSSNTKVAWLLMG